MGAAPISRAERPPDEPRLPQVSNRSVYVNTFDILNEHPRADMDTEPTAVQEFERLGRRTGEGKDSALRRASRDLYDCACQWKFLALTWISGAPWSI